MKLSSNTGKVVTIHIQSKNLLLILLQLHGNTGIFISGLRNVLNNLKVNSTVYLDGSDSVMLMLNNQFIVRAALNKNNMTGVSFKY